MVIPFNSLFEKIWLIIIDPMIVVMSSNNKLEKMAGIYSMAKQHRINREGNGKDAHDNNDENKSNDKSSSLIDDGESNMKRWHHNK